ncbi:MULTISPECIES: ABC transporter permease DevC [Cyanophyceae]|uniref:ABC transporter permease DevC n=1 Tax=Cyanophyceae TaxID=3028117 RepID=UPI00168541BD|nr:MULTISPECIES: ABC transporter permease DevC [Cyanophyceae]MBD1918063.1 FtsX-like permease family protein [Phormidium sp. FACHB-77]MBD2030096.1 FtsX-like permease family protein [Phormidium sp. FACHB-322]MBD2051533.1 FtsX-like permease family protein [Leptolyngbya sp. FACHB-60]
MQRTPLALLNLIHDRKKFLTSMAGVAFAVLLMFLFSGFKNALYDSQTQLLERLNGEIVIINRLKENMFVPRSFARRRLYQAQAFDGVEGAYAIYLSDARWKNPETRKTRPVRVIAYNPSDPVLPMPEVLARQQELRLPNTAMIDERSRDEVGPRETGVISELADREIRVVGTFSLGTDFASGNGNLIMSDQNFLRFFANRGPEEEERSFATADIGLLRVTPGTDIEPLVQALSEGLPKDVLVLPMQGPGGFIARERTYWEVNTSIGFIFSLLTAMGFVVGIILVYQILYTDVADHWSEYATLKAIGYDNAYLFGVVIQEAIILSVLGFIPGFLISALFYNLGATVTGLLFKMTLERVVNLYLATFIMCLISGAVAVRKVQRTDPAEVFGL